MENVFKITKEIGRAKSLFEIARDRLEIVKIFPRSERGCQISKTLDGHL